MQGFKSFPEKTRIGFENGVTAIIGPNGSGKSNVSDAVRWVLGEMSLKSLRGSKMEDVIFNGTSKRSQANYASVSIFLDAENADDPTDETVVTRKYYRSGESEYYLNKKQVRLKDIYEAFYDTGIGREGYSVIGQGKIAEVLSQKGDERRSIFEEAAGISKFRYKKAEAERKLSATEDNLTRINDILSEIGTRLAPLEKEAEDAKRFLALSEEKKGLEVTLWLEKIETLREELSKSEELFAGAKLGLESGEEKIKATEKEIDEALSRNYEIGRKLSEAERRISELELKYSEEDGKRAIKENDIAHFQSLIAECAAEIASCENERSGIEESLALAKEAEAAAEGVLEAAKKDYSDKECSHSEKRADYTKKSLERNDLQRRYSAVLEERSELSVAFAEAKANLVNAKRNAESSKEQIERYEKRIAEIKESIALVEGRLSEAQKLFDAKENAKKSAEEELAVAESALEALKSEGTELSLAIASFTQQKENLERMERLFEGYSDSVKNVIEAAKDGKIKKSGGNATVYGTVSSRISTDEEYVVALETALGAAVQFIIVEDENDAKACINYLKDTKGGRASFFPVSTVKGGRADVREIKGLDGYVGIADELCKFDSKFEGVFSKLLGDTVVARDLDSATALARRIGFRYKIVSLDGQTVHAGGSFTGGSSGKRVGILTRSVDIERLGKKIEKFEGLAKAKQEQIDKQTLVIEEKNAAIGELFTELSLAKSKLDSLLNEKTLESVRLEEELERFKSFSGSNDGLMKELSALSIKAEETEAKLAVAEAESDKLSKALFELGAVVEKAEREAAKAFEALNTSRLEVMSKENELARAGDKSRSVRERGSELEIRLRECALSKTNAENNIEARKKEIAEIEANKLAIDKQKADVRSAMNELLSGREENEKLSFSLRSKLKEVQAEKDEAFKYFTGLESRNELINSEYANVTSKLWDEYELTYSTAEPFRLPKEAMKKAPSRLASLKSKIRSMGNINVNAVEEYRETKERFDFLSAQTEDLNKTRRSLDSAIAKLEETMKATFMESFNAINEAFEDVFVELFGGGSAKCALADPENPLTCGIDITIRPPGKSVKSISLLSGGEQSFAAVALYLALQRINPAPFCIFDEIESALDEINVVKLAGYIKNHSDSTQYILITHRRGTMECADVIYGITMREKGVSDHIKLDINSIEKNLEAYN